MVLSESWWTAAEAAPLLDLTAGELLTRRAAEFPDRPALVAEGDDGRDVRLSYAALAERARRWAAVLTTWSPPGSRVAVCAGNVAEWPVLAYAASLAGMVLVPVNPDARPAEVRRLLGHSQAQLVVHGREHRGNELRSQLASALEGGGSELRLVAFPDLDVDVAEIALPTVDPHMPAVLQYTSGTTGEPKGVLIAHRAMVNNARFTMEAIEAREAAVCLSPLPMFHTAGSVTCMLGPLWLGGTLVLVRRPNARLIVSQIVAERPSVLLHVPPLLNDVLGVVRTEERQVPRIAAMLGGAAHVPARLVEEAQHVFGGQVHNLYGQSELSSVLTIVRRGACEDDVLHSVGLPLPHMECRIVDPASGATQPLGAVGEICARGYQSLLAYVEDPEGTAAVRDVEGWVHTGDLGTMDRHGTVRVTGRLKELIIRGGENVMPTEVEDILRLHPAVTDAAVFGIPDERLGESIAAAVVCPEEEVSGLREALGRIANSYLALYKIPERWFVTTALPRTSAGKVRRRDLRRQVELGPLESLREI